MVSMHNYVSKSRDFGPRYLLMPFPKCERQPLYSLTHHHEPVLGCVLEFKVR
jgi:hypothetical protein